ncbi:MAG: IS21 family transposase [Lentisphaeria bacterium]|jgi:transposase
MANIKQVNVIERIQQLFRQGVSQRRIARELGVSRNTVARYAGKRPGAPVWGGSVSDHATHGAPAARNDQTEPHATHGAAQFENPPLVPDATHGSETPSRAVPPPEDDARSLCAPHADFIRQELALGLSGRRIFQDLQDEFAFSGSYASVKRYLRRLGRTAPPVPFRRLCKEPGLEMQVDYGAGAPVYDDRGRRRKTHLLCCTLSCSRRIYCEVHYQQDTQSFIRGIENAFRYFGGVTATVVIDNLKAGVIKADLYDPVLNPMLASFARHYGTCVLPCRPGAPRHKGRVENTVGYVQDNALKGRRFESLNEQNKFLGTWQEKVSDHRFHGTEKRHVIHMYEEEKPCLRPLPPTLFPCFSEARRKVHRDGHVEVMGAYYSVPPEYTGREVWVRHDGRVVTILNDSQQELCVHAVAPKGKTSTLRGHVPAEKTWGAERGGSWLSNRIGAEIGEGAKAWAEEMARTREAAAPRVMFGLLALLRKHSRSDIEFVCNMALETRADSLQDIKALLERVHDDRQAEFRFDDRGEDIRELAYYETLTKTREVFT